MRCTKDACDNHLCEKCRRCSDCCECEVALAPHPPESVREALHGAAAQVEPLVVEAASATPEALVAEPPIVETPVETPVVQEPPIDERVEAPTETSAEGSAEPAPAPEQTESGSAQGG
ncbi:MAG TPA: hypothetical protein VMB03_30135 [Bryobacteraceae bacterium]|nr:hypothetical protein [Bryobacteraceae bacterium]